MGEDLEAVEIVRVRPYARLLTMLGEQLIKNDRIALVELIKNSYDADATVVNVDFVSFSDRLTALPGSSILIVDGGDGMEEATIRSDWLNPATPGKLDRKKQEPKSNGGRILQGEKGIGRFAMFKLGSRVQMTTRAKGSDREFVVDIDLSFLDEPKEEAATDNDQADSNAPAESDTEHRFIEDIPVEFRERTPLRFADGQGPGGVSHGTSLEISALRSRWGESEVRSAFDEVARLQPLMPPVVDETTPPTFTDDVGVGAVDLVEPDPELTFRVDFLRDGVDLGFQKDQDLELKRLFDERAVLRVSGHYSEDEDSFLLNVNGHISLVSLGEPVIRGLKAFKDVFEVDGKAPERLGLSCGSFDFSFFIFDLTAKAPAEYRLDKDESEWVKKHRIYLYRDGVRVLPYGDRDDDWLRLDVMRATQSAGRSLSNDQVVGFVYISHEQNPDLRDKTNREGLLESGPALGEFVALLQVVLSYVRRTDYATYLVANEKRNESTSRRERVVLSGFEELLSDKGLPKGTRKKIEHLHSVYRDENDFVEIRLERTEDLAGVGLSVEAASHDIIATANQALTTSRSADRHVHSWHPEDEVLLHYTSSVVEGLSFVSSRLEDVQGLFVSTRKGKRDLEPATFVSRVARMYGGLMKKHDIMLEIDRSSQPLKVRTTDAALLQVFVNLFDNSIYWLSTALTKEPLVRVEVDHSRGRVLFADNGPGVRPEDEPFIFEPFFSGKGTPGKGLGLYIARQVSSRNGFSIDLVTHDDHKIESGANFLLTFDEERRVG